MLDPTNYMNSKGKVICVCTCMFVYFINMIKLLFHSVRKNGENDLNKNPKGSAQLKECA